MKYKTILLLINCVGLIASCSVRKSSSRSNVSGSYFGEYINAKSKVSFNIESEIKQINDSTVLLQIYRQGDRKLLLYNDTFANIDNVKHIREVKYTNKQSNTLIINIFEKELRTKIWEGLVLAQSI